MFVRIRIENYLQILNLGKMCVIGILRTLIKVNYGKRILNKYKGMIVR